jgi:hypothetical protein
MIRKSIWNIGEDLVKCSEACADVIHDVSTGVLPRCLILDNKARFGRGCLVAGINPGRSKSVERAFYRARKSSYDAVIDFWMETGRHFAYYKKLREFVDAVGLTGPIIWSDLAKCENGPHQNGLISLQTLRTCTGRYLQKELQAIPKKWPIIGVGAEAYKALAYLEPNRTVIGIPHPTGSHGQFSSLCKKDKLLERAKREINHALSSATPIATWIAVRN